MEGKGPDAGMTQGLAEGGSFGDYRVVRRLGKGGMGEVWLLENASGGQLAAKILTGEADHESRKRFLREADLALGVKHPNLVEVFDVGEDPDTGLCYILMEYVPGGTLADVIRETGPQPLENAVAVVKAIAGVLELGRQKGIVHRDIKPANIMFGADGAPKLADLGIARGGIGGTDTTTVTQTGMMIGTPAYMAPEQMLDAHHVDTRADIYSLGVVFFEMLTGERPNKDDTVVQLMAKAVKGEPIVNVRKLRPDVPVPIARLLDEMVALDKDVRIATPSQITEALAAIERGDGFKRPAWVKWARKCARLLVRRDLLTREVLMLLCALAALFAILAVLLPRGSRPAARQEPQRPAVAEIDAADGEVPTGCVVVEVPDLEAQGPKSKVQSTFDLGHSTLDSSLGLEPSTLDASTARILGRADDQTEGSNAAPAAVQGEAVGEPEQEVRPEPKADDDDKAQTGQDALSAMFPGWKTSSEDGTRDLGRMDDYRGEKDVLCARASNAGGPMTFSSSVVVSGKHPVLYLRLANHKGDRRCRLRVKVDGKAVYEKSITDGWTRAYVRLDSWIGKKVKIELDQMSSGGVYWSAIKVRDSQLLSEFAREQEVEPMLKKAAASRNRSNAARRKTSQQTMSCGEMFPGWTTSMGESYYEEEFRGYRRNLLTQSAFDGDMVVLSRRMKMPSSMQFPKPQQKLYVTVATCSGGEFGLQIKVNGAVIYGQDVRGESWKPLVRDLSAWEGKSVLLELVCVPKGRNRVSAYWNRIEVK